MTRPGVHRLGLALLLAGCTSTGPGYRELATAAADEDSVRIFLFRTEDSSLYLARRARLHIDGETFTGLRVREFVCYELEPGEHSLRVDLWDSPGNCTLTVKLEPGLSQYFQVDPREASFWAFAAPAVAAGMASDSISVALASGMAVSAGESYGKDCGGAFRLYPVDQGAAHFRMLSYRMAADDRGRLSDPEQAAPTPQCRRLAFDRRDATGGL